MKTVKDIIKVGTRSSPLAIIQAQMVIAAINVAMPNKFEFEIVKIRTLGDDVVDTKILVEQNFKSIFTKTIDEQLLPGKIDIAVHSLKDVSVNIHEQFYLATLPRDDPRDALITTTSSQNIEDIPVNSILGTSSIRRKLYSQIMNKNISIIDFRGNLNSRMQKLENGVVQATIMAVSGMKRLGISNKITSIIDINTMLPSICQGIISVMCMNNNTTMQTVLNSINHYKTNIESKCERMFAGFFNATCQTPLAGYAVLNEQNQEITIKGEFIKESDLTIIKKTITDSVKNIEKISQQLATAIKQQI